MKLTHKLCGTALLAATGVALVMPNTTKANDLPSKGKIEFTYNSSTDVFPTDPGETTGTTITTGVTSTNPGPMGIYAVSDLDFDSHDILTSQTQRDYNALPVIANAGKTDEFEVQNAVWFQDLRATDSRPYQVSAQITSNFKEATGTYLKGANITYKNITVTTTADPALKPSEAAGTQILTAGDGAAVGNSAIFINNKGAAAGVGYGKFELNFGTKAQDNYKDAVTLNIPTTSAVGEGLYNATITWTMADVL